MVLQLEDCIDCMKTLHPEYQCVFLFDHSSGHAKNRKNGLDANVIRKYYLLFLNILQNNLWDFFTDFQYYTKLFQTFTAIQNGCT